MGQSYRELIAWQKAMSFVMDVYKTTKEFPRDELYNLATHLRRAAISVATNIAEAKLATLHKNSTISSAERGDLW